MYEKPYETYQPIHQFCHHSCRPDQTAKNEGFTFKEKKYGEKELVSLEKSFLRKSYTIKLFRSSLPVQSVVRKMNRQAPNAQFWNDIPHDEWYPPTPLDLLECLLNVSISESIKRELVVQYVIDWISTSPEDSEHSEKQLALETIKIMTNQMLNVNLEKIYYILDQGKKALTSSKTSDDMRALGEKVFSMKDDEISYEKLWGKDAPMTVTIGKHDLQRFEQRMKMQMEGGKVRCEIDFQSHFQLIFFNFQCQFSIRNLRFSTKCFSLKTKSLKQCHQKRLVPTNCYRLSCQE